MRLARGRPRPRRAEPGAVAQRLSAEVGSLGPSAHRVGSPRLRVGGLHGLLRLLEPGPEGRVRSRRLGQPSAAPRQEHPAGDRAEGQPGGARKRAHIGGRKLLEGRDLRGGKRRELG